MEANYSFLPTASDLFPTTKYSTFIIQAMYSWPGRVIRHLLTRVPIPRGNWLYQRLVLNAAWQRPLDGHEIIDLLIEQGLDVNPRAANWREPRGQDPHGTVLHAAVRAGSVPNVQCVLRYGPQILRDNEGRTPLGLAEHLEQKEIVGILKDWLQGRGLPLDYEDEEPVFPKV